MRKTPWHVAGLHFKCMQCGECCSGPGEGYIWVTKPEVEIIADFLKIPVGQMRKEYLQRVGLRTTIVEQVITNDCMFLREVGMGKICTIHPVRPNQCRTWPFWTDNLKSPVAWNRVAQKCSGINRGRLYSFEEIEKIRKSKKWWADAK